jgi:hypothetical protein
MYLPSTILNAKVLVTVKTYPLPSNKYEELVCTAGITEQGKWIRIYPIPFRSLPYQEQYKKYNWVELDLVRNTSDFRPESYRPKLGLDEPIKFLGSISTSNAWEERKNFILKETFTSMNDVIKLAKSDEKKSLATFKPIEIVDFVVEEDEREWKQEWQDHLLQMNLFDRDSRGQGKVREIVRKLPYKYSYKFFSQGDSRPRQLMIEDWEIGALYWNCLARAEGNEEIANQKVREQYFDTFVKEKDLYFFIGTTKQYHNVSPNPFVIIGVFYPPKNDKPKQLPLL